MEISEIVASRCAELARLRAKLDALPETRDGVKIVPGMVVWYADGSGRIYGTSVGDNIKMNGECFRDAAGATEWVRFTDCYSTEQAAREAAKKGDA